MYLACELVVDVRQGTPRGHAVLAAQTTSGPCGLRRHLTLHCCVVRARHPLGKVPYLEDGELVIFDSTVIDEYLEERYGPPRLMPSDPAIRMRARELENFVDEAMLAGSVPLIWMAYWSEPAKRDADAMEKGREILRTRDLPYLERVLGKAGAGGYACGEFSLADVPLMAVAMVLEVDAMKLDATPKVDAYLKRLRERPSYRAISPRTTVAEASSRA